MSGKPEHEIPMLAYVTSKGSVGDFIKRYLDETAAAEEVPSWHDLRASLQNRFAEITDPQHALAVMRRRRQNSNESVQLFAERLLQIAEDAYSKDRIKDPLVQQQLVDIFCDGLTFDYLYKNEDSPRESERLRISDSSYYERTKFKTEIGHSRVRYNRKTEHK